MRVAHLVDSLHPDGSENGLAALAGAAGAAGLELVVVAISGSGSTPLGELLRRCGATVVELGAAPWDPRSLPRAAEVLRGLDVALVHTHMPNADVLGAALGTRLRIPVVSTLHLIHDEPADRLDKVRRTAKVLARKRFVTRTIAISQLQRDWYQRVAGSGAGLVVLPDGVADPAPTPPGTVARTRARLGVGDDGLLAVSAAPMRRGKGQDMLLDAVAELPADSPWTVALTGDGPLRAWLESRVSRDDALRGRVRFTPYGDPTGMLAAADLQLHTTRTDGMPSAVVRGLAAGVPAIVTRVGGLPEIVTRETGVVVPLDVGSITAALQRLGADDALRERMGRAARERYLERFEAVGWARRLREVYDTVLAPVPA
ncbi:MAG: glycosyltransferase [Pseudonocardia sp.]|nr:glycosyltransferase [Pseudonocardia sp.]